MANTARKAVVIGGAGALGSAVAKRFKQASWSVLSVDLRENPQVDNVVNLDAAEVAEQARKWSQDGKVHAVVHVAGGFEGGDILAGPQPVEKMWEMNGASAFTASFVAAQILQDPGLLVLTGAQAVRNGPVTFAAGYSMSKAAVHQLAIDTNAFLETAKNGKRVACILPSVIDTPANRKAMPDSDFSQWSNPADIAEKIFEWSENPSNRSAEDIFVSV